MSDDFGKITVRREDRFTVIRTSTLAEPSLSYAARGLFAFLETFGDGEHEISSATLARCSVHDSEADVATALYELAKAGLVREVGA